MLGPQHIRCLIEYFDGIDATLSARFLRTVLPGCRDARNRELADIPNVTVA